MNLIENYKVLDNLGSYDREGNPLDLTVKQLAPICVSWSYNGIDHKIESPFGLVATLLENRNGIAIVAAPYKKSSNKAEIINPDGSVMWDVSEIVKLGCTGGIFSDVYYVLGELCFFINIREKDFRFSFDVGTGKPGSLIPSY